MTTGETIALTRQTFVDKVMSLLLNMLSRLVITFLPRSKSCPTLCDPMDYTVHGIFQASILKWVAFPFSRGIFPTQGSNPGLPHCRKGSPRILEWVGHPMDLPDPGIEPGQVDSLPTELSEGKEFAYSSGDPGSIPESGRSPGEGHDNPLQYSCPGNPMDRGAWWSTVHDVTKNQT